MTRAAEYFGVVTGRALRLSRVRLARVSRHEVERVKATLPGALMTARAKALLMTSRAVQSACRRDRSVRSNEIRCVNVHLSPARRIRRARELVDDARAERTRMTRATARLRVTRSARLHVRLRQGTVRFDKV